MFKAYNVHTEATTRWPPFADDIFKNIYSTELKFAGQGQIDNKISQDWFK